MSREKCTQAHFICRLVVCLSRLVFSGAVEPESAPCSKGNPHLGRSPVSFDVGGSSFGSVSVSENGSHIGVPNLKNKK